MRQFIAIAILPTRLVLALMLMQSIVSCKTTKGIEVVRGITHDTLFIDRSRYDSVYLDNTIYVERQGDTVFVHENHVQYKYKVLSKTISKTKTDSIPVVRTVTVKGDAYVPTWWKWLFWTCVILAIVFFVRYYGKSVLFTIKGAK